MNVVEQAEVIDSPVQVITTFEEKELNSVIEMVYREEQIRALGFLTFMDHGVSRGCVFSKLSGMNVTTIIGGKKLKD